MRIPILVVTLGLGAMLPAQATSPAPTATTPTPAAGNDLAATKAKLSAALQKAAALRDTAFDFTWGPDGKKKKNDDAMAFAMAWGVATKGKATGSWHQDLLHVALDGDNGDELLLAGRMQLAKDAKSPWQVRAHRYADGGTLPFMPDPALLLQRLAAWDLAVTQRAVGSLDDRPVEIVSVTLAPDQVVEAIWAGLLPETMAQSAEGGGVFRMIAGGGGGARPVPSAPEAQIDLAIHLDPATGVVHQLHFRGWAKANAGAARLAGGAGVVVVGRALPAGGGDDDEDEDEDDGKAEPAKEAPLAYEHGLPVRPRKKTTVNDCTIRLRDHGQKLAPELDAAAKKLLGR
ncbi:MAG: hypothetical protein JNK15_06080 [Planctomycetes bacterium]|nr:hypothetical protein [Planctomycetota bacterium]